jgi:hypothetical protein
MVAKMALKDLATDHLEVQVIRNVVGLIVDEDTFYQDWQDGVAYTFVAEHIHKKLIKA